MVKESNYKSGYQTLKQELIELHQEKELLENRIRVICLHPDSLEAVTIKGYYKSIEEMSKITLK